MEKVVVITGGAGGIGQACVKKFKENNKVVVLDVNQDAINDVKEKYDVDGYCVDLLNIQSIHDVVETIIKEHKAIDVLVQAAGVMSTNAALDVDQKQWEFTMNVNVEGMFFMMQEVVKQYMKDHGGVIMNFASEAAMRGFKGPMASVHYAASKGAVISMSRQLAVEWSDYGIRVNSISPGGVLTPAMEALGFEESMDVVPMGRLSRPFEIANTVAFICSDESPMTTGQNIVVDGGCAAVGV